MSAPVASCNEDACAVLYEPRRLATNADPCHRTSTFPWFRLWLGCAAIIAGVVSLWEAPTPIIPDAIEETASLPVFAKAPPPLWQPIARPLAIYALDALELKPLPFTFTARRNETGAREDNLTFGTFDHVGQAHVHLDLQRSTAPEPPSASLFIDLARRASEAAGLAVIRSAPPMGVSTKFGLVEAAEVALAESEERACFAFRFAHQDVGFRMGGWFCPPKDQPMDRKKLACTINRISLLDAGNDQQIGALFAHADRQRTDSCAPAIAAAPAPVKAKAARPPAARTRLVARPSPAAAAAQRKAASPLRLPAWSALISMNRR